MRTGPAAAAVAKQDDEGFWNFVPVSWHWLTAHVSSGDVATVTAAVFAALVAALVAVRGYRKQQEERRRVERSRFYAEALQVVEDYAEAPYRILRCDGTPEKRWEVTRSISDIQSRMSFYAGWMEISAEDSVRVAYAALLVAVRAEAGEQMKVAWLGPATKKNKQVSLGTALRRVVTDAARARMVAVIKADLRNHRNAPPTWRSRP